MIEVKKLKKIYRTHIRQENLLKDIFMRRFKELVAVNEISFTIQEGDLVGFIGPNGAGKTTTLKMLGGILYPTSGFVSVAGFIPFQKKPEFLKKIAFIMGQRNQLIWDLPAYDTFILQKTIYEIDEDEFKKNVGLLADLLDCAGLIDKPVKTLSLGERMKMELIAGLLHNPEVIFFDEPTIGLDIFSQEAMREFIKEYQDRTKSTILLTSHYLEDVKRLARRLIIIDKGSIVYDGSLINIIEQYSREKHVTVTLNKTVNETELRGFRVPFSYTHPKITFQVSKTQLPEKIKQITQSLPFSDLVVSDESIEDIIKNFFRSKH